MNRAGRRSTLLAVAASGLLCTSFHVPGGVASAPTPAKTAALPAVGAAPRAPDPAVAAVVARMERYRTGLDRHELRGLARTVVREARRHEVAIDLVLAVMHVESRFNPFAVSPVGAIGLMQLLPTTAEELALERGIPWRGTRTLFEPEINVVLGVAYLRWLRDRYGSLDATLAAYNWGPGRIDRRLRAGRPLPARYVDDVLAVYRAAPESRS